MEILERFKGIVANAERPVVYEFGACDGYHSQIMINILAQTGKAFIYHAFEPVAELHDNIHLFFPSNATVKLWNYAISDNVGISDLFKSGGTKVVNNQIVDRYYGSSSIRKPKLVTEAWKEMTFTKEQVKTTTFDAHLIANGLDTKVIDFVWADIQGAEIDLINGGANAFKNVKYFYTEFSDSELYEGEIGLSKICEMLPNFEVVEVYAGDVLLKNKLID